MKQSDRCQFDQERENIFDQMAAKWDKMAKPPTKEQIESLFGEVEISEKIVLDVGAGTGVLVESGLQAGASQWIACDLSGEMLKKLASKVTDDRLVFDRAIASIQDSAKKQNVAGKKVLAQKHQAAFAKWLGYQVLAEFSAEELSPAKMGELAALKPDLIIDNYHNPQGQGIAEIAKCQRVELRNFPGAEHKSLQDLFLDNAKKLGL